MMIDRRLFLFAGAALASGCLAQPAQNGRSRQAERLDVDFAPELVMLGPGGRLGVAAIEVDTGRNLGHDEASRYSMCSTFKLPLAA